MKQLAAIFLLSVIIMSVSGQRGEGNIVTLFTFLL